MGSRARSPAASGAARLPLAVGLVAQRVVGALAGVGLQAGPAGRVTSVQSTGTHVGEHHAASVQTWQPGHWGTTWKRTPAHPTLSQPRPVAPTPGLTCVPPAPASSPAGARGRVGAGQMEGRVMQAGCHTQSAAKAGVGAPAEPKAVPGLCPPTYLRHALRHVQLVSVFDSPCGSSLNSGAEGRARGWEGRGGAGAAGKGCSGGRGRFSAAATPPPCRHLAGSPASLPPPPQLPSRRCSARRHRGRRGWKWREAEGRITTVRRLLARAPLPTGAGGGA